MRKFAGISEILSTIIVIAVMAIVAAVLFVIFSERAEDTTDNISSNINESMKKAKELLAIDNIGCTNASLQFIIHNYSDDENLQVNKTKLYKIVNGNVDPRTITGDGEWRYFDGSSANNSLFWNGTSLFVTVSPFICSDELLIITPAGEHITVS